MRDKSIGARRQKFRLSYSAVNVKKSKDKFIVKGDLPNGEIRIM